MIDTQGRFILEDYMRMEPFCSFLPGLAGERGIPMWCYYVNRGQCVTSFGVRDKEHAIMEFSPAHQAYQYTQKTGFRTFLKIDGKLVEPFARAGRNQRMMTGMNELLIEEQLDQGLIMRVAYYTLPHERAAALMRRVTLINQSSRDMDVEMLDGMPALLPYGINLYSAKQMTQTAKAWMQAEDRDQDVVCFRVRASMEDSSDVQEVSEVNYAMARTDEGERMPAFVSPRHVFGYDTSLERPLGFEHTDYNAFVAQDEVTVNQLPCCFFGRKLRLCGGASASHSIYIGQAESKTYAHDVCKKLASRGMFEDKAEAARALTQSLTDAIDTHTGDPVFDMYCRQTMLDNLLRGGVPVELPGSKLVSLYSRKHGDPERDYNAFSMSPEYASQGNGNFRDVNQNRRSDVLFDSRVGDRNVRMFYALLQADGYNPLVIKPALFTLSEQARTQLLALVDVQDRPAAEKLLSGGFTPGALMMSAEAWRYAAGVDEEGFLDQAFRSAKLGASAEFSEGYWTDHWTYNLDQIDSFLSVYPEREKELLMGGEEMTWFVSPVRVLPRAKRYVETPRGVRQYRFHEPLHAGDGMLRTRDGRLVTATLMEKLVTLCAVKAATLDPYGMGMEMEGGKPGWYDALNGLPGLLGSSMPETLELARMLPRVRAWLRRYEQDVSLMQEAAQLLEGSVKALQATKDVWQQDGAIPETYEALCDLREAYRARVYDGVSGEKAHLCARTLDEQLGLLEAYVMRGVRKAMACGNGLCPTYFAYEVTDYCVDERGLHPKAFKLSPMPDFLEGQVRYLRLDVPQQEKEKLVAQVRASKLYDEKLSMYKVNAQLADAGYEIGRAHAFTPGWLENESVWLHMEYKYLLELLRTHQYTAFTQAFHDAAIPFLDPRMYGRSTLENSSFIASSANPDAAIHGKGFVARLSGSTAEFLSIWQIMMLGERLFTTEDGELTLRLAPMLPAYLTKGVSQITATLLGKTKVVYSITPDKAYIPGEYTAQALRVLWRDGTTTHAADAVLHGEDAARVRSSEAERIELRLV